MDNRKFIRAAFDLECSWEGMPPSYRVFLNDELFTERTWDYDSNIYVINVMQIFAEPGEYKLRVEAIEPNLAHFTASAHRVEHGSAYWANKYRLVIQ